MATPEHRTPPNRRRIVIVSAAALAAVLIASGASWFALADRGSAVAASEAGEIGQVSSPPSPTPAATSPSPEATQSAEPSALKLGQAHRFTSDGFVVSVTALKHKHYDEYEGVQVRTCNRGKKTFPTSETPWFLSYDDGESLVDDTVVGGGLMSPSYVERDLAPGRCAKGWISFVRPKSGQPDGVEYHVEDVTSARWAW